MILLSGYTETRATQLRVSISLSENPVGLESLAREGETRGGEARRHNFPRHRVTYVISSRRVSRGVRRASEGRGEVKKHWEDVIASDRALDLLHSCRSSRAAAATLLYIRRREVISDRSWVCTETSALGLARLPEEERERKTREERKRERKGPRADVERKRETPRRCNITRCADDGIGEDGEGDEAAGCERE